MKVDKILELLDADLISNEDHINNKIDKYYPAFNISDILSFIPVPVLIITEIIDDQIIRLADISESLGIVFVNDVKPNDLIIEKAKQLDKPIILTRLTMMQVNDILHEHLKKEL